MCREAEKDTGNRSEGEGAEMGLCFRCSMNAKCAGVHGSVCRDPWNTYTANISKTWAYSPILWSATAVGADAVTLACKSLWITCSLLIAANQSYFLQSQPSCLSPSCCSLECTALQASP